MTGGPAGGRDINATAAGPLPKRGACAGTHPCGFLGRHRLAGGGGCMANPGRDGPHGVPSGLSGLNMAAIDTKNLYDPPWTIRPTRGRCPAGGHAGVGGKGPAFHVCPGPEGGGGQRMHIRPQSSGYLGVEPRPAMGQAVENFQGGSGFRGTATARRARPTPAHGRIVLPGLRGSAGSHPVRRWDEQRILKWVWPGSCRGPTEDRPGGMPGDERAQPTSGGWDFRGDTSCGWVDGIASKLLTCTRIPPTNLNVCRLRDCLGQPLKESVGERPT